jgi:hypothetical protein
MRPPHPIRPDLDPGETYEAQPAPREEALRWLDELGKHLNYATLGDLRSNTIANACIVATRREIRLCTQCHQETHRLYLLGAYVLCCDCARGRARVQLKLQHLAEAA